MSRGKDNLRNFVLKEVESEEGKKTGDRENYGRLCPSILKNESISIGAEHLYACMQAVSNGKEVFYFPASVQNEYNMSHASFSRWKKELIEHGFITEKRGDVCERKTLYRFSKDWQNINKE